MRLVMVLIALASLAAAPTSEPSNVEFRAHQAFTRGEYAAALPLLQKLSADYKSQPDKLGPIQEQINVCIKAIAAADLITPTMLIEASIKPSSCAPPVPIKIFAGL